MISHIFPFYISALISPALKLTTETKGISKHASTEKYSMIAHLKKIELVAVGSEELPCSSYKTRTNENPNK